MRLPVQAAPALALTSVPAAARVATRPQVVDRRAEVPGEPVGADLQHGLPGPPLCTAHVTGTVLCWASAQTVWSSTVRRVLGAGPASRPAAAPAGRPPRGLAGPDVAAATGTLTGGRLRGDAIGLRLLRLPDPLLQPGRLPRRQGGNRSRATTPAGSGSGTNSLTVTSSATVVVPIRRVTGWLGVNVAQDEVVDLVQQHAGQLVGRDGQDESRGCAATARSSPATVGHAHRAS